MYQDYVKVNKITNKSRCIIKSRSTKKFNKLTVKAASGVSCHRDNGDHARKVRVHRVRLDVMIGVQKYKSMSLN